MNRDLSKRETFMRKEIQEGRAPSDKWNAKEVKRGVM